MNWKIKKINSNIIIKSRIKDKINYKGILIFESLNNEEDLLDPTLYKDIINSDEITKKESKIFYNYISSFNDEKKINY